MTSPMSRNPNAQPLIDIGRNAIAKMDDAAARRYYADGYVLHTPAGDLNLEQLISYFGALRDAFTDLKVERAAIIGEGPYLAARTIFSGKFDRPFTQSPAGRLEPTGKPVQWEVMNFFLYDENGRLLEEWIQSDSRVLLQQLGAG